MANFNTNQARHLYVASGRRTSAAGVKEGNNGDIALLTNAEGDFYFVYKNADGIDTRSDIIPAGNIEYVNKRTAAQLAKPLIAHQIELDTDKAALTDLVGKTIRLHVGIEEFVSFSPNDSITLEFELACNSTNTAHDYTLYQALAMEIVKNMPKRDYPFFKVYYHGTEVTRSSSLSGNYTDLVLVAQQQKFVRGKLSGEPVVLNIYSEAGDIDWMKDTVRTVAETNTANSTSISPATISGDYEIADLEYFSLGERGDVYRGSMWPNNYEPTYAATIGTGYDMLTVQYFWQGHAENIQKSPRTIQVVGSTAIISALYNTLVGSGSGSGA